MNRILLSVVIAIAAVGPLNAAGPQSVYGPSAPSDSAFVRVINLLPDPLRISLGATRIGPVAAVTVSSYQPVLPDIYLVRAGGNELEVIPQSGAYLTIACTPKGIILFEDPAHTNPARAQLFLYNLSSSPQLDLKSADGKTNVITAVKSGESGQVVVNAVSVTLALFNGSTLLEKVGVLPLQRGSSFSIFVLPKGSGVTLLTVKADVKVE